MRHKERAGEGNGKGIHTEKRRWGWLSWAGRGGGVASGPLMNQCQRSDEKIIKKQAGAVLNTAKGKRPIPLYGNTIWTRMKNRNKREEAGEN